MSPNKLKCRGPLSTKITISFWELNPIHVFKQSSYENIPIKTKLLSKINKLNFLRKFRITLEIEEIKLIKFFDEKFLRSLQTCNANVISERALRVTGFKCWM